ncbi:MAG: glycosyltransferase family 39 protein [Bacteroidetes bacterium]|nr:glycosyltransferase family 39 protein [Bacteroidota bacterium]
MINLKKYNPDYYYPLFVLLISLLVFLPNLDRHHLWQDEAQTALISRSVLANGIPLGHDGKNSFSQESGAEIGKDGVYKWHPWIPFYIHAGFFKLFGQTDFAARLPDALFGIGTVILCFWLMRSTGKGMRASLLAAGILMLMIPFLLLSRQCRYYSMASFFSTGCIWAYLLFLQSKKYSRILLTSSTIILFHIQMIYGAIFISAALVHLTFARRELLKQMIIPLTIVMCSVIPWIFYTSDISYQGRYGYIIYNQQFSKVFFFDFIRQLLLYVVPFYLLIYIYIVGVWQRKNIKNIWRESKIFTGFYFLFIFLALVMLAVTAPNSFFRYLVIILPVCAILLAEIVELGFLSHPILGYAGIFIVLLYQPLPKYFYEITHNLNGPIEGIVTHLRQYAEPMDTVAVSYGDMPIKWYTGLYVIGALSGEKLENTINARWVIVRKHYNCAQSLIAKKHLESQLQNGQYRKNVVETPDTPFENREDPANHLYKSAEEEDNVVIYERIK